MNTVGLDQPILHIPGGIRYTCHSSGACCEVFPHIPIEPEIQEQFEHLDLAKLGGACGCTFTDHSELRTTSRETGETVLPRRPETGHCTFYTSDKRCGLHAVYGVDIKPSPCRDFPIRYFETPGGLYVGLSFVCSSVRGNKGALLTEQADQLATDFPRSRSRRASPAEFLIADYIKLSWEQYLEVEQSLFDILSRSDIPMRTRMIGCNILLNFIKVYDQGIRGEYRPLEPPRMFGQNEIRDFLDLLRKSQYAEVFRISSKRHKSVKLQRMFLGMLMSFANNLWQRHGRMGVVAAILGQYARHATGLGSVKLNPLERPVPYRVISAARIPEEGPTAELVHRYVTHCIYRKDLLLAPTIMKGVNILLLNYALIQWYGAGVAWQHGRETPEHEDFSEAIRHIEMLYGYHSKFHNFFDDQPIVGEVVESFMSRKNYPFLILN